MDETEPPEPSTDETWTRASRPSSACSARSCAPAATRVHAAVNDRVVTPAWNRVTGIESRVQVMSALAVAIVLTALLPARVANHPRWLLPGLASILFVIVLMVNPLQESRAGQATPAVDVRAARGA